MFRQPLIILRTIAKPSYKVLSALSSTTSYTPFLYKLLDFKLFLTIDNDQWSQRASTSIGIISRIGYQLEIYYRDNVIYTYISQQLELVRETTDAFQDFKRSDQLLANLFRYNARNIVTAVQAKINQITLVEEHQSMILVILLFHFHSSKRYRILSIDIYRSIFIYSY